jgi:hypothetical protein
MRNGCIADPNYFENELPSFSEDSKKWTNHPGHFLKRSHAGYQREAPMERAKTF